jgi:AraC-like DNA-binding protein
MIEIIKEIALFSPFILSLFASFCLFLQNWKKDDAKMMLGYFMLFGSVFFAINIIRNFGYFSIYNYLLPAYISLYMLASPLIYIYVRSLTVSGGFKRKQILHFLPAIMVFIIGSILYFQLDYNQRINFIENLYYPYLNNKPYFKFLYIFLSCFKFVFIAQIAFYYLKIKRIMHKHQKALNDVFSDSSGFELNWVKVFFNLMTFWGIFAIIGYGYMIDWFPATDRSDYIVDFVVSFLIAGLYILASMQKSLPIVYEYWYAQENHSLAIISNNKLKEKLLICFEEKKLFFKKDLTIWDVCRETNSNRTYISNLINEEFKVNFNSFVNKYRVEHALKILRNVEFNDKSLNEIANLSGFNSLASFNRAFKKITNSSPGSYKCKFEIEIV